MQAYMPMPLPRDTCLFQVNRAEPLAATLGYLHSTLQIHLLDIFWMI